MSFESKEHYWVIVFEPSEANCHFSADTRLYWGTKKGALPGPMIWLKNAHANNRKFEETSEATK